MPTACERFLPAHSPNSWSQPRALLPCRPQKLLPSDTWTAVFRIKALEGHEFDGLKEGKSTFRASDHQHVQDVLVGEAFGKELGLGHYKILATVTGDAVAGELGKNICHF